MILCVLCGVCYVIVCVILLCCVWCVCGIVLCVLHCLWMICCLMYLRSRGLTYCVWCCVCVVVVVAASCKILCSIACAVMVVHVLTLYCIVAGVPQHNTRTCIIDHTHVVVVQTRCVGCAMLCGVVGVCV